MKSSFVWVATAMLAVLAVVSSCSSQEGETLIVASETRDCYGVGKHRCMLIKSAENDPWLFFNGNIKRFDYEPGYEYVLRVKAREVKEPPQDGSSVEYRLVKVVSREQKVSEGLPSEVE